MEVNSEAAQISLIALAARCQTAWLARPPYDRADYPAWLDRFMRDLDEMACLAERVTHAAYVPPFVVAWLREHNRVAGTGEGLDISRLDPASAQFPDYEANFWSDDQHIFRPVEGGWWTVHETAPSTAPVRISSLIPQDSSSPPLHSAQSQSLSKEERRKPPPPAKRTGPTSQPVPSRRSSASARGANTAAQTPAPSIKKEPTSPASSTARPKRGSKPKLRTTAQAVTPVGTRDFNGRVKQVPDEWLAMPVKCELCSKSHNVCLVNFVHGVSCLNCSGRQKKCTLRPQGDWSREQSKWILWDWMTTANVDQAHPGQRIPAKFSQVDKDELHPPKWFSKAVAVVSKAVTPAPIREEDDSAGPRKRRRTKREEVVLDEDELVEEDDGDEEDEAQDDEDDDIEDEHEEDGDNEDEEEGDEQDELSEENMPVIKSRKGKAKAQASNSAPTTPRRSKRRLAHLEQDEVDEENEPAASEHKRPRPSAAPPLLVKPQPKRSSRAKRDAVSSRSTRSLSRAAPSTLSDVDAEMEEVGFVEMPAPPAAGPAIGPAAGTRARQAVTVPPENRPWHTIPTVQGILAERRDGAAAHDQQTSSVDFEDGAVDNISMKRATSMVADAVLESANAKLIGIVHATCEHLINELRAEVRDLQTVVQDQGRMIEALKAQVVETAAPASALVSASLASLQAPNPALPPPAVPTESAPVSVPAPTQASVQVSPSRNVIKAKRGGPPGVRVSSAGPSPTRPTSMLRPPGEEGLREQCPVPGGPATHVVPDTAPAAPLAVIAPDPTGSDTNDQPAAASQHQGHDVPDTGSTGSMSSPTGAAFEDNIQPAPSESRDTLAATPVGEEPTTTEENAVVQSDASDLVQSPVQDEEVYSTNGEVEDVEEGELSGDGEEGTGEQASQVAVPMDTD